MAMADRWTLTRVRVVVEIDDITTDILTFDPLIPLSYLTWFIGKIRYIKNIKNLPLGAMY